MSGKILLHEVEILNTGNGDEVYDPFDTPNSVEHHRLPFVLTVLIFTRKMRSETETVYRTTLRSEEILPSP